MPSGKKYNMSGLCCQIYCNERRLAQSPLVTICIVTYNHDRYIAQAIESVVTQKFHLAYQIVVADDGSSDRTLEICMEWPARYPEKIKVIGWMGRKDVGARNFEVLCLNCKSKYVALCAGDDYWTDPMKLQKKVDHMERYRDCTICFHSAATHWEERAFADSVYSQNRLKFRNEKPSLVELLRTNYIQTNSALYRWNADDCLFEALLVEAMPANWMFNLMHTRCGRIGYLDDVMSTCCRYGQGIWTDNWGYEEWFSKFGYRLAKFYRWLKFEFGVHCRGIIRSFVLATLGAGTRIDEVSSILCPAVWWVRFSGVVAFFFRCLMLCLTSLGAGVHRRYSTWQIVFLHRIKIDLSQGIMT